MAKIVWDESVDRRYETGVDQGVLYPRAADGTYPLGVAWNGLTSVNENPTGADETKLWADNIKYLSMRAAEEFGATIEAYTYPDEFMECDGTKAIIDGVYAGQQTRKPFGFCYRTVVGNDAQGNDYGYKLHLIYGCTANPSSKNYQTINESPEAVTFSWEIATTMTEVGTGFKPTATIVIDSTKVPQAKQAKLEELKDALYGTQSADPYLPLPTQVLSMFTAQ